MSSVQREFARERRQLAEYIRKDLVFSKFFDVFLFEEIPAGDVSPKAVYLKEVAKSDIYLGLIGREYGFEDDAGVSPTEREYDCAGEHNKPRFVFVKKSDVRAPKEHRFLEKVESERVRKTFPNLKSLKEAVSATLVRFLEERRKIQTGPFDSSVSTEATIKDLSVRTTSSGIARPRPFHRRSSQRGQISVQSFIVVTLTLPREKQLRKVA